MTPSLVLGHLDCLPPSPSKGSLPVTIQGGVSSASPSILEALILYAYKEQLQRGQQAVDIFAALFAKQQPVVAR